MTRCVAVGLLAAALALPAFGQAVQRKFPGNALRGELQITQPPEVLLNGQPAALAPGARIRGDNNMIQLSGSLAGPKYVVNYTRDGLGMVKDVWILTPQERAMKPWPVNEQQLATWFFNPDAQTWTKP